MFYLLDLIFPTRTDERVVRDTLIETFLARTTPQIVPITHPGTVILLNFSDPTVRAVIHEAKYHGNSHAFTLLGLTLTEYLSDREDMGLSRSHVYLVPIPLGKGRYKERGYNQVEEVVKRALRSLEKSDISGFTLETTVLTRERETPSQVSLPRHKREENMRNAFRVEQDKVDPLGTYLIIDDVLTTGATLQAAIDALAKAGARDIVPLALAH